MSFPGTRWYAVTVPDPKAVRDQKKVVNHITCTWNGSIILFYSQILDSK